MCYHQIMLALHFICRGNIYRSRLAEAYAKSLQSDDAVTVSSSGIEAKFGLVGNIAPVTLQIAEAEAITDYLAQTWTQTTQSLIDSVDIIVFMSKTVHSDAIAFLKLPEEKIRVWNIPDAPNVYPDIKRNVDSLLASLKQNT